jgi:DUF4097 and DUF4098 domain-containing protein YvlB
MRPMLRHTPLALLTTGALAVAAAGCEVNLNTEGMTSTETSRFEVSGQPDIVLDTFDGNIEVHSWDRNEVEVEVEKRAMEQSQMDEIRVSAQQEGNRIVFKVTGPDRRSHGITIGSHVSPSARLRVAIPRISNLQATSGDGSISVENISGKVGLDTQDGSVRAVRLVGDIRVRSGDGTIRLEKVEGNLDLETVDGRIELDAKPTILRSKTGDGSIQLNVAPDTTMTGDWEVTSGDGSITMTLPSGFNAELDAETGDGSVRASHPGIRSEENTGDRDERRERRRVLRTTMGQGGKVLRVRTSDGTVRIES